MTWELGPDKDFSRLLEYEWRLEEFLRANPRMGGICQYHVDNIPRSFVREALWPIRLFLSTKRFRCLTRSTVVRNPQRPHKVQLWTLIRFSIACCRNRHSDPGPVIPIYAEIIQDEPKTRKAAANRDLCLPLSKCFTRLPARPMRSVHDCRGLKASRGR